MNKKEHPLYSTWKNMMARCYVKSNPNYKYYGAKGVTVCDRWHDFWSFVYDVDNHLLNGHLLYNKEWNLDKDIKSRNIYSLENCLVIPAKENQAIAIMKQQKEIMAISDTRKITLHSVSEASRALDIKRPTLINYLKTGKQHSSGYYFKYCN